MASIISSGIGSGLDISGIVLGLVAAEGQPVETRLALNEARAQAKLSAFGSLKSTLSGLRDKLDVLKSPDKFLIRTATSGNEDVFSVSAGSSAIPASYALEVVQLAQSQKLTSSAFTGADAVVGTGALVIRSGSAAMTLNISGSNNTLADIRDAINAATDNPGVTATIVNADSGSYLILTAEDTGLSNTITITQSGGDGGLSSLEFDPANGLASLTETAAAQDALIRIDGLDIVSDSNTFVGAVQGVTISVLATSGGTADSLTVENDNAAAKSLIADFVDSYNQFVSSIDASTSFDAEAEIGAPLIGDSTVRAIRDQLRRELSTETNDLNAPFSFLSQIGIEVEFDGKLSIDDSKLDAALANDFVKVGQLFSTSDGFATRLHTLADGFLETDGIIESRTQGLTAKIEGFGDDREALGERLASLEARLFRQFNALDSLLAELNSTSNFLTQQLNNLPGATRPGRN
jgi:flagellar hook-associated protein 2